MWTQARRTRVEADMTWLNKRGFAFLAALGAFNAAAIACGSSSDEGGGSASGAKSFYLEKVHQPLVETCSKCHGSGFRGAPVFLSSEGKAAYNAIEGFPGLISAPSISPLVQKGAHSGPAFTSTQSDLVTQWLKLEVQERNLGSDPGTPKNLRAAFKAFGDCMDYARWKELKLHTIATTVTDGNNGTCRSCHNYGAGSMWWNGGTDKNEDEPNNALTFTKLRSFPYVQRLVIGRVVTDGNGKAVPGAFDGIEASRRVIEKGTEAQQLQANAHPRYSISTELATNLSTYVLETLSNMNANRCQGVTLPDAGVLDAASY
jgi:hypothetical protein